MKWSNRIHIVQRLTKQSLVLQLLIVLPSYAQQSPAPKTQHLPVTNVAADAGEVYTFVEHMPELPSGGGTAAIVTEIQKLIRYPALDLAEQMRYSGIKYTFVVDSVGTIRQAAMVVSSDNPAVDKAILTAVRSLPRLRPGMQDGRLVQVRFTFNISCIKLQ
jgi:TonB family protein